MMKFLILFALFAVSQSATILHPAWWGSSAFQTKDTLGNYAFGYHDGRPWAPSYHSETGDASGKKVGSYGVHDADGKVRVVDYVADHDGFKANVKTTDEVPKDVQQPAAVTLTGIKTQTPVVAPVVAPVAYFGHPYSYYGSPYYVAY